MEMVTNVSKRGFPPEMLVITHKTIPCQRVKKNTQQTWVCSKQKNSWSSYYCFLSMLQKEDTQETMAAESRCFRRGWEPSVISLTKKPHSDGSWGGGAPDKCVVQFTVLRCRRHNGKHKVFQNNGYNFNICSLPCIYIYIYLCVQVFFRRVRSVRPQQ